MPVFGLGTWLMGGSLERDSNNDDKADIKAIQNAVDAGIYHIDTAELYANGHSERLVGEAIQDYDREKLFVVSKVKKDNLAYEDLIRSAKASLDRLQTSYLDLYLIHSPSDTIPIQETMKAMDFLKKKNLVKNIGVSNFTVERLRQAQSLTENKIVANQLHLNLIIREAERRGLVDFCQQEDVMLIAWRPVQEGLLTKKNSKIMKEMCSKYDKTPAQVAINWLVSQDNIVTLSKMRNPEHLKENLGALGWEMEQVDVEKLRQEFPDQQGISDIVPLR